MAAIPRLLRCRFVLRHAEPVADSVLHDGFDPVKLFLRCAGKLYTLRFQLFIGLLAIVGLEHA